MFVASTGQFYVVQNTLNRGWIKYKYRIHMNGLIYYRLYYVYYFCGATSNAISMPASLTTNLWSHGGGSTFSQAFDGFVQQNPNCPIETYVLETTFTDVL